MYSSSPGAWSRAFGRQWERFSYTSVGSASGPRQKNTRKGQKKKNKIERKENRGSTSQSVSVLVFTWFHGKTLRTEGMDILAVVLHYIQSSMFCKVFCEISKLSSAGERCSFTLRARESGVAGKSAEKGKSKRARHALGSSKESAVPCKQQQPISSWLSPRAPKQKGCPRQAL